jgi:hypothetical protein
MNNNPKQNNKYMLEYMTWWRGVIKYHTIQKRAIWHYVDELMRKLEKDNRKLHAT